MLALLPSSTERGGTGSSSTRCDSGRTDLADSEAHVEPHRILRSISTRPPLPRPLRVRPSRPHRHRRRRRASTAKPHPKATKDPGSGTAWNQRMASLVSVVELWAQPTT